MTLSSHKPIPVGGIPEFSDINFFDKNNAVGGDNSVLRLFNLSNIDKRDLESYISNTIGIDLDNPENINYLNVLYGRSINTYKNNFLIDIRAPFTENQFKNKKDVLVFLRQTSLIKHRERRQIYCDLTKLMFAYHEVISHPIMKNTERYAHEFVSDNILMNYFPCGRFVGDLSKIMDKKEGKEYYEVPGRYYKTMLGGGQKEINATLRFRGKSQEKTVIKMLGSEKGVLRMHDLIRDSIGVEFEADSKKDSYYLLEYEYFVHKKNGDIYQTDFRQKLGFYTQKEVSEMLKLPELSQEFKDLIEDRGLVNKKKKNGSSKYQDCKFAGMIQTRDDNFTGCESRVVIKGNKNQSGMAASEIIDGKKIIDALIGLRGWVSKRYIERLIKNIVLSDNIMKDEENILVEYMSTLVKLPIPRGKRNIYSSEWRLKDIISRGKEYPDFIVNAIKKHLGLNESSDEVVGRVRAELEGLI